MKNDFSQFFSTTSVKIISVITILTIYIFIGTHGWLKSQPTQETVPTVPVLNIPSVEVHIPSVATEEQDKKPTAINKNKPPVAPTTQKITVQNQSSKTPVPVPETTTKDKILTVSGGTTSNYSWKQGSMKVPFSTLNFYPSSGDSVVDSITVTRGGSSQDSDIADIYLVDYPYGKTIFAGPERLNANHQVTFIGPWTFKPSDGHATAFSVEADTASSATVGDVIKLPVTSIVTTSTLKTYGGGAVLPVDGMSITVEGGTPQSSQSSSNITPTSQNLSGSGQQATQKITLQSGLAVFNMTHSGQSNFILQLLDSNGNQVGGSLTNEIGSFNGSIALNIKTGGSYLFNVKADGEWTINIQQPRPSQAPQTTTFSGHGATATALFSMSSTLHTISMTHNGQSNFIVSLLNNSGNQVGNSLSNEIGVFNGSKAVSVPDGIYLFNVRADGDWTISIQ